MKCESCGIKVKSEFVFAIQNNQCPACGNTIMQGNKLAAYLSLKSLLSGTIKDGEIDVDKLASIIIANFELKQIFKEDFQSAEKECIIEEEAEIVEEDEEDPGPVFDSDGIRYEKVDKKKAQNMLQKMRDEALSEALDDRDIDFTDEEMLLLSDEGVRQEYELKKNKEKARQAMMSGSATVRRAE